MKVLTSYFLLMFSIVKIEFCNQETKPLESKWVDIHSIGSNKFVNLWEKSLMRDKDAQVKKFLGVQDTIMIENLNMIDEESNRPLAKKSDFNFLKFISNLPYTDSIHKIITIEVEGGGIGNSFKSIIIIKKNINLVLKCDPFGSMEWDSTYSKKTKLEIAFDSIDTYLSNKSGVNRYEIAYVIVSEIQRNKIDRKILFKFDNSTLRALHPFIYQTYIKSAD